MSLDVPVWLRERVYARAHGCCEYCLAPLSLVAAVTTFHAEHVVPRSHGGPTTEANLPLSCPNCNLHKADRVSAVDPVSRETVSLFSPRTQLWSEHLTLEHTTDLIVGCTPTGRATVSALCLNERLRVETRRLWIEAGWYPPREAA